MASPAAVFVEFRSCKGFFPSSHAQVFLSSPFYPRKDSLKVQAQPVTWIRLDETTRRSALPMKSVLVLVLLVSDAVYCFCWRSWCRSLPLTHDGYGRATSFRISLLIWRMILVNQTGTISRIITRQRIRRTSSWLLMGKRMRLARNNDLDGTVRSIREIEDRFNKYHDYPYVLLNEEQLTDEFKT